MIFRRPAKAVPRTEDPAVAELRSRVLVIEAEREAARRDAANFKALSESRLGRADELGRKLDKAEADLKAEREAAAARVAAAEAEACQLRADRDVAIEAKNELAKWVSDLQARSESAADARREIDQFVVLAAEQAAALTRAAEAAVRRFGCKRA